MIIEYWYVLITIIKLIYSIINYFLQGITTLSLITYIATVSRKYKLPGNAKKAVTAVLCAGYLQVLLGILTLVHHVPVSLGACHQSGSLIVLSTMIWLCHELKYLKYVLK